jgi:hypothetical protein
MANLEQYFRRPITKKTIEQMLKEKIRSTIGSDTDVTYNRINNAVLNLERGVQSLTGGQKTLVGGKSYADPSVSVSSYLPTSHKVVGQRFDGDRLSDAYVIKVRSKALKYTVIAFMQDKIGVRVGSNWEPFLPLGTVGKVAQDAFQALFKKALVTRFTSRRIWRGTSPIEMNLTFNFQAIDDPYNEVVLPAQVLMQMCLPGEGERFANTIPLLTPPGPSPYKIGGGNEEVIDYNRVNANKSSKDNIQSGLKYLGKGDEIDIKIGNFMHYKSVIIKDVQPVFDTRMHKSGYPIGAEVNIVFETYEIMTKEALEKEVFIKRGT